MTNAQQRFDVYSSAWLSGVSGDVIARLGARSETRDYSQNETVYALGGPQEWLWGLGRGRVKVLVAMNEMEPVLGHIHHPGAWFGESELIHGIDGLVEMRTVEQCSITRIHFSRFEAIANDRPELWRAFAKLASMNQLLAMSAANDLALRTGRSRIVAALLRLCGRRGVVQGSWMSDTVQASQQDIASLGNLSLSNTSLHLSALAREGLIRLEYGRVVILEPDRLTDLVAG